MEPPRAKPFVFKQTYFQTSENGFRPVNQNNDKVTPVHSSPMPSPSPIKTAPFKDTHGFSSFVFNSTRSSDLVGDHIDNVSCLSFIILSFIIWVRYSQIYDNIYKHRIN